MAECSRARLALGRRRIAKRGTNETLLAQWGKYWALLRRPKVEAAIKAP